MLKEKMPGLAEACVDPSLVFEHMETTRDLLFWLNNATRLYCWSSQFHEAVQAFLTELLTEYPKLLHEKVYYEFTEYDDTLKLVFGREGGNEYQLHLHWKKNQLQVEAALLRRVRTRPESSKLAGSFLEGLA